MKNLILTILFISLSLNLFSQIEPKDNDEKWNSLTIGILEGGGSFVGFDVELMVSDHLGFQVGGGIVGFGGGINYHLKPSIRSSFLTIQYWNQGTGQSFVQNAVGPAFVYRGKKWLTFQIGLAFPLSKGPAYPSNFEQTPIMLSYAIGAYIPF